LVVTFFSGSDGYETYEVVKPQTGEGSVVDAVHTHYASIAALFYCV